MAANDDQGVSNLSVVEPFNPVLLSANVRLQRPLSRRGKGPGLLIFLSAQEHRVPASTKTLEPVPLQKWAEEGFAVVEVTLGEVASRPVRDALNDVHDACETATDALKVLPECTNGQVGVIGR